MREKKSSSYLPLFLTRLLLLNQLGKEENEIISPCPFGQFIL